MKCLREVEEIVKEACKTTPLNDIVGLVEGDGPVKLTSSDCQLSYVKSLIWNFQVLKVPDKILYLLESKCLLNHEHSNLVNLFVYEHDVPDENLSAVCRVWVFRKRTRNLSQGVNSIWVWNKLASIVHFLWDPWR